MRRVLPVHNVPVVHLGLDISGDIDVDVVAAAFAKSASLMDLASERPDGARVHLVRRAGISAACRHGACDHEVRGAVGKARRNARSDDRRRRRPRPRPSSWTRSFVSTASWCRSTAFSCGSSTTSISARCSIRRASCRSSSNRSCFRSAVVRTAGFTPESAYQRSVTPRRQVGRARRGGEARRGRRRHLGFPRRATNTRAPPGCW